MSRWPLMPLVLLVLSQACLMGAFAQTYMMTGRKTVDGLDISCKQLNAQGKLMSSCRECGGIATLAAKCEANSACRGFDMETYDCGYLKKKADTGSLQYTEGAASFCKVVKGSSCTGDYMVYFNSGIKGGDLDCNWKEEGEKQSYCKVMGNHLAVMDACTNNKKCEGFVLDLNHNGKFGTLKASSGPRVSDTSSMTFVKVQGRRRT